MHPTRAPRPRYTIGCALASISHCHAPRGDDERWTSGDNALTATELAVRAPSATRPRTTAITPTPRSTPGRPARRAEAKATWMRTMKTRTTTMASKNDRPRKFRCDRCPRVLTVVGTRKVAHRTAREMGWMVRACDGTATCDKHEHDEPHR